MPPLLSTIASAGADATAAGTSVASGAGYSATTAGVDTTFTIQAKVPMETSGPYLRYSVTMDGYFDKVDGLMTAYVSNSVGPPAGGNTTINRTMLYEMDRNVREAVNFSIGDCCSDNKNYVNLVLKAQLLVDQKMRLFDISFLHKQRHGKDDSELDYDWRALADPRTTLAI